MRCGICDLNVEEDPLPCGHYVCVPCITHWLELDRNCPVCILETRLVGLVDGYALHETIGPLSNTSCDLPEIASEYLSFNLNNDLGNGISGTVFLCEMADINVALKLVRKADLNEARLLK
ncbi:hypothetical protein GEMRC1_006917 [Eukaryota sp. GEM-RC1]